MKSQDIKKIIKTLPDTPGVYVFKCKGKIVYIGKATSLKDRVRSYFNPDIVNTRSPLVFRMLNSFDKIDHIPTDSVLEALVLEAYLIKKHQPEANIKEKDNKSFNFVVITKEDFPRVLVVRGRELLNSHFSNEKQPPKASSGRMTNYKIAYSFGPFPNGSQLREAMKIVRKMFPYRDRCQPCDNNLSIDSRTISNKINLIYDISYISKNSKERKGGYCRPCFNYQIGLCPGVCAGTIDQEEYTKTIGNIKTFFEGNKKKLLKSLENQMKAFAKAKEFEKANKIKRTIFTLNHIQDISLIKENFATIEFDEFNKDGTIVQHRVLHNSALKGFEGLKIEGYRIESYDIAHMSGQNVVGVMTVVEDGEVNKSEYRKFKIKNDPGVNDSKALSEVLERRLAHIEWRMPNLIVVDGGKAQKNIMEKVLSNNGVGIPVVSVVKDERHRPREILGDKKYLKHEREIILSNAEAHRYAISFHKNLRSKKFLT